LEKQWKGANFRRSLAVLALGLIIGKEIDLFPSATFPAEPTSRSSFSGFVQQNAAKLQKILSAKKTKKLIENIDTKYSLHLTKLLDKLLVEEENLSWSEVKRELFEGKTETFSITVGSGESRHIISIN
jgi:hypothetical protein